MFKLKTCSFLKNVQILGKIEFLNKNVHSKKCSNFEKMFNLKNIKILKKRYSKKLFFSEKYISTKDKKIKFQI
jgi:hypothetical protein